MRLWPRSAASTVWVGDGNTRCNFYGGLSDIKMNDRQSGLSSGDLAVIAGVGQDVGALGKPDAHVIARVWWRPQGERPII